MNLPKVSVVVPIYNVSPYIERCARSLLGQTLQDIEFLFIDDCSPDNSIEILNHVIEDYTNRKSQIRILKMPSNSGQAAVRRHGINLAKGDYIIHCDADDWVDADLYAKMYEKAKNTNADVVICPICDEFKGHSQNRKMPTLPETCREVLRNWYQHSVGMFAWNKLVRRSIYVEHDLLPYEGINMWEDNGLFLRVFYYANALSSISDAAYHYNRTNQKAMTKSYSNEAVRQMIECARRIDVFFKDKPDMEEFEKTSLALKFYARINLVTDSFKRLSEYYKTFPETNRIIPYVNLNAFSQKGKIRFLAVKYKMAWLFVILFKFKRILSNS